MYQPGNTFAVAMDPRKKQEHIQMALRMMAGGGGLLGMQGKGRGNDGGLLSKIGQAFDPANAPQVPGLNSGMLPGPVPNIAPGMTQVPMQPMQPGGFGSIPGPIPMPNLPPQANPGLTQMPMPPMQAGGFGAMPQYRNLGFGPMRWS